ncbi:MAG: hypothetical protein ACK448_07575 [Bacteroidota bacterium]
MKKIVFVIMLFMSINANAQTDIDGLFMAKRNFCVGIIGGYSSWDHYWEGTTYRNNENIGTVSSQSAMIMGNYGVTDKLNVLFMLPWVKNEASAGTLIGQQGFQDLTLLLKNEFWIKDFNGLVVSAVGVLGGSLPVQDYTADYLPLAIGMKSKTAMGRLLVDAQKGKLFATASATGMIRGNVILDRTAYYTTEMIYSNKVVMPSVFGYNVRLGWREGADKIFELVLDGMNTLGGFDIRRNDMPFLSNNMDMLRVGVNTKYPIPKTNGLSIMAGANTVIGGRNMGQSTGYTAGLVYQFLVKSNKKELGTHQMMMEGETGK